jgi:hypothetical protein
MLKNVSFCTCTSLDLLTFFQLLKNSKYHTFFVSSGCERKPWFPKVRRSWKTFQAKITCTEYLVYPRVVEGVTHTRHTLAQITTYAPIFAVRIMILCPRHRNDGSVHRSYIKRSATQWYLVGNNDFSAIYRCRPVLRQLWRNNAAHAPNTCTNSCNESSGTSVGIAASYYFNLWICGYVGRYCSQLLF